MELLLEDGGRGLVDKLRVELQYYQQEWGCVSVCACACERRVGKYSRMIRGKDMVVVSIRNYIGRSTVLCPRKGET